MLLVILALFWVALLAPIAVRRFRDNGTEKSIESFHAEHEVLSRQEYTVPPAHRLDVADYTQPAQREVGHRPRLTVVHADDTYRSLESRDSWDEWSANYDYDDEAPRRVTPTNRYAAAYSSVPNIPEVTSYHEPPIRRRSMRAQRKMVFGRLVLAVIVTTALALVVGYSLMVDLAVVTWVALASYVALALYALSQGYLHESSLGIRFSRDRQLATVQPLYRDDVDEYETMEESEFYDPDSGVEWRRESPARYALG
jgi:hypothetical protein